MNWLLGLILAYVIGGLTFIPLLVLTFWVLSPQVIDHPIASSQLKELEDMDGDKRTEQFPGYRTLRAGEILERENINVKAYFSGWLTVTREYYQFPQIDPSSFNNLPNSNSNSLNDPETSSSSNTATGSIFKMMKGGNTSTSATEEDPASMDAKKLRAIRRKNRYFAVLKHGNLFLYQDEEKKNVQHVIVLSNHIVSVWPRDLLDGQLFTKKSSICIMKKDAVPQNTVDLLLNSTHDSPPPKSSYFVYGDMNHQKEDWYHALLRATTTDHLKTGTVKDLLEPSMMARGLHFATSDMIDLIQTINSSEGQLTTKWINAALGRLFLSSYRTEEFKDLIKSKVVEKLKKIRTPGFLDDLQIKSIDVGHSAPFITYPKLNNLSPEGDLDLEFNFLYVGGLTIEVSTKIFLNLGARFKQREFDINLKIQLKKMQGDIVAKMKPTPSGRIWYGFKTMPKMDLVIKPIISSRAMNYNLVTNIITNKFKEAIKNSIVLPFMDDLVYYDTTKEIFRGGIWDTACRPTIPSESTEEEEESSVKNESIRSVPPPVPVRDPVSEIELEGITDDTLLGGSDVKSTHSSVNDHGSNSLYAVSSDDLEILPEVKRDSSEASTSSSTSVNKFKNKAQILSKRASSILDKKLNSSHDNLGTKDKLGSTPDSSESGKSLHSQQSKYVTTSVNKVKGWYSASKLKFAESSSNADAQTKPKEQPYTPPEMISSRRITRKTSQSSVQTNDSSNSVTAKTHHRHASHELFMKQPATDDHIAQVSSSSPTMFINDQFIAPSMGGTRSPNTNTYQFANMDNSEEIKKYEYYQYEEENRKPITQSRTNALGESHPIEVDDQSATSKAPFSKPDILTLLPPSSAEPVESIKPSSIESTPEKQTNSEVASSLQVLPVLPPRAMSPITMPSDIETPTQNPSTSSTFAASENTTGVHHLVSYHHQNRKQPPPLPER